MNSELTSTMIAMAIAVRTPAAICGSAAGSTTRHSSRRSEVPRARADHSSIGSTLRAPLKVATTTGSRQASAITAILEKSPMPSQIMNSGISAGLGTG